MNFKILLAELLDSFEGLEVLVLVDISVHVGFEHDFIFTEGVVHDLAVGDEKTLIVLGKLGNL